jgi:seryl-tRNA synthetase
LKLRFKDKDGKPTSTYFNGSSLVLPRVLAGTLKINKAEGIVIPEVLRPYCGFDIID